MIQRKKEETKKNKESRKMRWNACRRTQPIINSTESSFMLILHESNDFVFQIRLKYKIMIILYLTRVLSYVTYKAFPKIRKNHI
ncbi:hypothetical protein V1478_014368 [Vespula squamosa]|uniref:Uncharacterized protein n=1 Tax=Vespula squamosa TaxID=30214 RepID=A0ABD2A8P6_VESSQ